MSRGVARDLSKDEKELDVDSNMKRTFFEGGPVRSSSLREIPVHLSAKQIENWVRFA